MWISKLKSKVMISVVCIFSMMFSTTFIYADSQLVLPNKPPKAPSARVSFDDIDTLNKNIGLNKNQVRKIRDVQVIENIGKRISNNAELQAFTGFSKDELTKSLYQAIYLGQSQERYSTYFITFESFNDSWTVLSVYDADRDILIDCLNFKHAANDFWRIDSRNVGNLLKGIKADVEILKNGNQQDKERRKQDFQKKYNGDAQVKSEKNIISDVFSLLATPTASASGLDCKASSETCSWVSIPYCAAAGLAGFWPGLACSVVMQYVCSKCD
ncbi:hypothetical protein [Paenibacillus popilliae]|uniref:Diaminopimelate decarboxylase n=1 Tax=Paenibacillus popilliae ATCC 14706 TaxID=1212764 RepID=M9LBB8_PAEPP|nr:hypothetical protein [Paenibacillus popilliae]GAC43112.1 diaminopimelate decarboxylase [Paenibacillus popilliae ATCC 14706]